MRFRRDCPRPPGVLIVTAALSVALLPIPSGAAPGDLDPTFGTGGAAIVAVGVNASARAVAVQSDGKILAAGQICNAPADCPYAGTFFDGLGDMGVIRLDSTGALDPSFGSGGVVTLPAGMRSIARAIALQPTDDKIVVAGGVFVAPDVRDYDFRIVRLLNDGVADGQLDTTFGTGGIVVTAAAGQFGASSVLVQPDGKILAGGDGKPNPLSHGRNRDFIVHRYLADGSPDATFGEGGRAAISMGRRYDLARTLLLQPDGAIVAAGYSLSGVRSGRFAIARLGSAGNLDPTFGRGGREEPRLVTNREYGNDAALLPDGRILAGGFSLDRTPGVFAPATGFTLAQLTTSGTLDPSFGTGGISSETPTPNGFDHQLQRVALQSDGKIVAAGRIATVFLARFLADGSLDPSFGTGGEVETKFTSRDEAFAVALQPTDGGIVIAGFSVVSDQWRMLVARYLP